MDSTVENTLITEGRNNRETIATMYDTVVERKGHDGPIRGDRNHCAICPPTWSTPYGPKNFLTSASPWNVRTLASGLKRNGQDDDGAVLVVDRHPYLSQINGRAVLVVFGLASLALSDIRQLQYSDNHHVQFHGERPVLF